jgi:hypothetical protein
MSPDAVERFRETARKALETPAAGGYCVRRYDRRGNAIHGIDWDAVSRVLACAVYVRPPGYSRQLIVVPGAVIAYVTDGPRRYCAEYRTPEQVETAVSEVTQSWEIHIYEQPLDNTEFARAVCLR